jgi:DNA polymerase III delta prime subunit
MPQPAWLIYGPPGCGKTTWILSQVKQEKKKLYHWNARTDRTLREGRETLHRQVRSQEPLFVWIEGADDLTQEAQAFLRRILETAAANVTCCLEVREIWKLSPPILSRCTIITMKSDKSYRKARNSSVATYLKLISPDEDMTIPAWTDISVLRVKGVDPYMILDRLIEHYGIDSVELQECIRAIGAGSSPWIQLTKFLMATAAAAAPCV